MQAQNRHRHGQRMRLQVGQEGHLSDLERGQKAIVLDFHNDNAVLRRRLLDMGITKGVEIEIKKIAPLGDPVEVGVLSYRLSLRKAEASVLKLKRI